MNEGERRILVERTPGRRMWEAHRHMRIAGILAFVLLTMSVWFMFNRIQELRKLAPRSPHFKMDHCCDCHEIDNYKKDTCTECFRCHSSLTRALLPNAYDDFKKKRFEVKKHYRIKLKGTTGTKRTVTQLCLGCHRAINGYVAMMNIATSRYVEVDMSVSHPIGLSPTEAVKPKTLPLNEDGIIDCLTCHDQHGMDKRMHLLRIFLPGNGHPPDFQPLCFDCHEDSWFPIRIEKVKQAKIKHGERAP